MSVNCHEELEPTLFKPYSACSVLSGGCDRAGGKPSYRRRVRVRTGSGSQREEHRARLQNADWRFRVTEEDKEKQR